MRLALGTAVLHSGAAGYIVPLSGVIGMPLPSPGIAPQLSQPLAPFGAGIGFAIPAGRICSRSTPGRHVFRLDSVSGVLPAVAVPAFVSRR